MFTQSPFFPIREPQAPLDSRIEGGAAEDITVVTAGAARENLDTPPPREGGDTSLTLIPAP